MSNLSEEMDSPFSQLYLSLQLRIKEAVPEIKYVAYDIGQLDFYETRPAVDWPCVLIKFPSSVFTNQGDLVQWLDAGILFRIGFTPFSTPNSLAPDIPMKQALGFFEIENKVYKALHGWSPTITIEDEEVEIAQPLMRMDAVTEDRNDPFIVRAMMMATGGEDASAQAEHNTKKVGLELE
jgi:hypothetical protein